MGVDVRYFQKWLNPKRLVLFEAVVIGLVAAIAAVILKQAIGLFGGWRIQIASDLPMALPIIGLCGGYLAGFMIENFAPEAAGSGIPHVKAALGYVPVVINLRVAFVKLVSTILALGSGLALGRQGPTVQIGAALAAQLSRWVPTSPDYQRQLIAVGAAAGLAAGFNAPIAGLLFVIEELLHEVSSLTLSTAILAAFTGGVVSRILGGANLPPPTQLEFKAIEIPFFILLGATIGVFAVLFNRSVVASIAWNRKVVRLGLRWRIAIAGLISGGLIALLPHDFRDATGLQQFLATGETPWQLTAVAFATRFLLTLIACSAETPGGLFVPSLTLGAALGSLFGNWELSLLHSGIPAVYALAGMGAFFGAVAKVPITAFVIVFEMTMDFNIVLPLMIVTAIAFLVSDKFVKVSLYTQLLQMNGVTLAASPHADELWLRLKAADIMQTKVESLPHDMTIDQVKLIFGRSHHRGFPVLEQGMVVGILTQTDLEKIHRRNLSGDRPISEIMTANPVTVSPQDSLAQVLYLLSHFKLSRLPVLDATRLVGIITRSDILRAEVERLQGSSHGVIDHSYLIYQTRDVSTGRGRLLIPLLPTWSANKDLLELGVAIAKHLDYEIECLIILTVPPHLSPAKTKMSTTRAIEILNRASNICHPLPMHSQIRAAHDPISTISEVIADRHSDLLLLDLHYGYLPAPHLILTRLIPEKFPAKSKTWLIVVIDISTPAIGRLASLIPPNSRVDLVYITTHSDLNFAPIEVLASELAQRLQTKIAITSICTKQISAAVADFVEQTHSNSVALFCHPQHLKPMAAAIACNLIFIESQTESQT